jgi:hypothetical protein
VRVATADFNRDGVADVAVGTGPGRATWVVVLGGKTQAELFAADPFEATFTGGVFAAAGDLNGDGYAEVIAGGGPRLFALSGRGLLAGRQEVRANFFAGDTGNRGVVRVAARNLDGDGFADLVAGSGTGAGSRVTGYSGRAIPPDGAPPESFAFDALPGFAGGVFVG